MKIIHVFEKLLKLLALIFIAVLLLRYPAFAVDETWKFFIPDETPEAKVISVFGIPDAVNIQYKYEDIQKAKENGGLIPLYIYRLSYNRFRGGLNILKGPLGDASSVDVYVENGKVFEVNWEYSVMYKAAAEALWNSDETIYTNIDKALKMGSKKYPNGNIMLFTCGCVKDDNCDGPITVMLAKETKDGLSK